MRSIDDLDVHGKRVLVRVDFNVPLDANVDAVRGAAAGGVPLVSDDTRIAAALATIEELRERGARLVLVSHLGRPKGKRVPELSMAPVADRLRELTGAKVTLAPAVVGDEVMALAEALGDGEILVLENVRFEPGETSNDPELAKELAALAEFGLERAVDHLSTGGGATLELVEGNTLPGVQALEGAGVSC
jgi:phosphoglycerate kinase